MQIMNKLKKFIIGAFVSVVIAATSLVSPIDVSAAMPQTPSINPGINYSNSAISVSITPDSVEAFCTVYTLDGTNPSADVDGVKCDALGNSEIYNNAFDVDGANGTNVTVKAISYDITGIASNISEHTYTFDKTAPIINGVSNGVFYNAPGLIPTFADVSPLVVTLNDQVYVQGTQIVNEGHYTLVATDAVGYSTAVLFTIDRTAPEIILDGANPLTHEVATPYNDPGFTATDDNGVIKTWTTGEFNPARVGTYYVTYYAQDQAGNTSSATRTIIVQDTINPTATITGPEGQPGFFRGDVTVTFADANIPTATLDGSPIASGAIVSAEGTHILRVTDASGRWIEIVFTIDLTDPEIVLFGTEGQAGYYRSGVNYSVIETNPYQTTLERWNDSLAIWETVLLANPILAEGYYRLSVMDQAHRSDVRYFWIDLTDPVINLSGTGNNPYFRDNVSVSVTESNPFSYLLTRDGVLVTGYAGGLISQAGHYILTVTDASGRTDTYEFWIDRTAPVVNLTGVGNNPYFRGNVTVTVTNTHPGPLTYILTRDGSVVAGYAGGTISGEGAYTLVVCDAAGNCSNSIEFWIDLHVPDVTLIGPGQFPFFTGTVQVVVTDTYDTGIIMSLTRDDVLVAGYAGEDIVAEGHYVLTVCDLAGNCHPSISFWIDYNVPVITLAGPGNAPYFSGTVGVTVVEDGSFTYALYRNNVLVVGYAGEDITLEGHYVLIVTDLYGLSDTEEFWIDLTDPVINLSGTGNNPYFRDNVSVSVTESNPFSYLLTRDGVLVTGYAGGLISQAGHYILTVTDASGRTDTYEFWIDRTAPVVNLTGVGNNPYFRGTVDVTVVEANPFTYTLFRDGVLVVGYNGADIAAEGHYVLMVCDAAGNCSNSIEFWIDLTAPTITLIGANPSIIEVFNPFVDPGFTANDNLDGNIVASVVVTGVVNTDVLGVYLVTYTVTDRAGNVTTITRTVRVVDTTKPVITIIGNPEITLIVGTSYDEQGATATDNYDGDITSQIVVSGAVNWNVPGVYVVTYTVTDSSGNVTTVKRTIRVLSKPVVLTPVKTSTSGSDELESDDSSLVEESVKGSESGEIGSGVTDEKENKKDDNKDEKNSSLPFWALLALLALIAAGLYLLYHQNPTWFPWFRKDKNKDE